MIEIAKLKELKESKPKSYMLKLKEIEKELFNKHCLKKEYNKECEPTYCSFRATHTCNFIKEFSRILNGLEEKERKLD